jgi:hypothetical protein
MGANAVKPFWTMALLDGGRPFLLLMSRESKEFPSKSIGGTEKSNWLVWAINLYSLLSMKLVYFSTVLGNDQASTIIFVTFATVKIIHTTFYLLDLLHESILGTKFR